MNIPRTLIILLVFTSIVAGLLAKEVARMPGNGFTSYTTTTLGGAVITLCKTTQICLTSQPGTPTITYTTILPGNRCPPLVTTYVTVCDD